MKNKPWLNIDPTAATLFFVGCVLLAVSRPTIEANLQSASRVQAANRAKAEKLKQIEISESLLAAQSAIAEKRFEKGCIMVVAYSQPDKFTSLTEGSPVIDRIRKTRLGANNKVCDANGGTSVLVPDDDGKPVVGEIFYTGNKALIDRARKISNARYALPNQ